MPTSHARILKAREDYLEWSDLELLLQALQQAAINEDRQGIRRVLQSCVHGFQPDQG